MGDFRVLRPGRKVAQRSPLHVRGNSASTRSARVRPRHRGPGGGRRGRHRRRAGGGWWIVSVNASLCALQLHLPFRADDLPSPYPLPSRSTVFLLALLATAPRRPTRLHAKISHLPALPISLSNFSSLSPLFCLLSVHCRTRTGVL